MTMSEDPIVDALSGILDAVGDVFDSLVESIIGWYVELLEQYRSLTDEYSDINFDDRVLSTDDVHSRQGVTTVRSLPAVTITHNGEYDYE